VWSHSSGKPTFDSDVSHIAVRAPFDLEKLIRWSQAQMDAAIDQVNNLHETEFCHDIVERHIRSQVVDEPNANPFVDKTRVASEFGICVHNSYMLACAWTLLHEFLVEMKRLGLQDKMVVKQMRSSADIRILYMFTYNMAKNLVTVGQQRLRSIVQNTPHFAPYFSETVDRKDGTFQFNNAVLRNMYKSYLDSAIIELCLPGSQFSPAALYQCLHDVEKESPKQLRHCPQAMWDAVGDLAEAVKIQDHLETPLLVPEGRAWQEELAGTEEPFEFFIWTEAQNYSLEACQTLTKLEGQLSPFTNLKDKNVLKKIWIEINSNCTKACGLDLDHLWQLDFVRANRKPHWTYSWMDLNPAADAGSDDDDTPRDKRVVLGSKGGNGKNKRLQITNGQEGYESDSSMPGLLDVSNSEEEEEDDLSEDDSEDEDEDDDDSEDEEEGSDDYDSEEEEEIRHMFREAMNSYNENPDVADESEAGDKYAEERKKNPFLKLLGSLKGRMFQKSSALRTDGKTTQTATSAPKKPQAKPAAPPKSTLGRDDMPPLEPLTRHLKKTTLDDKSKKTTIEDADDESDEPKADKKKKKKKPKKKKKTTAASTMETDPPETPVEPQSPTPSHSHVASEKPASPPPASPIKKKPTPSVKSNFSGTTLRSTSGLSSATAAAAFGSSISLALPTEQKAESARSYLASIGANQTKTKVKTRPDQPVEEKKSLFTKLGFRGKDKEAKNEPSKQEQQKINVFGGLKKKSKLCAQKLFGISVEDRKGSLKWEQFVQLMLDLGFEYDPSTAGSSVRFDPPNPNDRSISFHKPHPDPTLHQNYLKEYRTKLMGYYAWSPEQLKMMDQQMGHSEID